MSTKLNHFQYFLSVFLKIIKYFKIAISSESIIFTLIYHFLIVDFNLFVGFELPFHYERSKKIAIIALIKMSKVNNP